MLLPRPLVREVTLRQAPSGAMIAMPRSDANHTSPARVTRISRTRVLGNGLSAGVKVSTALPAASPASR